MNTDIMTIKEVVAYLKLTEKTAYRLAAEGKTPRFKVGGSWRLRRARSRSGLMSNHSVKKVRDRITL